jgi:hypothetical protein
MVFVALLVLISGAAGAPVNTFLHQIGLPFARRIIKNGISLVHVVPDRVIDERKEEEWR